VNANNASTKVRKELLFALESARTRLAVAIAAETKSTPPKQWHYYLDTAERVCRLVRRLREADGDQTNGPRSWMRALNSLKQIPVHAEAERLCEALGCVAKELE
jgi:hypothetical protein